VKKKSNLKKEKRKKGKYLKFYISLQRLRCSIVKVICCWEYLNVYFIQEQCFTRRVNSKRRTHDLFCSSLPLFFFCSFGTEGCGISLHVQQSGSKKVFWFKKLPNGCNFFDTVHKTQYLYMTSLFSICIVYMYIQFSFNMRKYLVACIRWNSAQGK